MLAHHAKAAGDVGRLRAVLDDGESERVGSQRARGGASRRGGRAPVRGDAAGACRAAGGGGDRALEMLRRPSDRMEGLAELAALSEAMADSHLELDRRDCQEIRIPRSLHQHRRMGGRSKASGSNQAREPFDQDCIRRPPGYHRS